MDRQQQYIQLARPWRGSPANVTPPATTQPEDDADVACLVNMCPRLYLAAQRGRTEEVMALLLQQHSPATTDFQAKEMVDLLLEWKPALADQVDSSGSSPLHFASSIGDHTMVHTILRTASQRTVYKKDSGGLSAIHVAARMGHHRVVEDILGACPDAAELRDEDGGTFVHAAAREKRSSVVSVAIKNPKLHCLLDAQDRDGNTPLHLAAAAGAPRVVESLLRKGKVRADVLNNDGNTAFDLAAGSNSFFTVVKLVVTLVAFGAQLRPQRADHSKQWSGREMVQWIEKMSDSLAVVAVLIATSAFAAGFNLPGGYSEATGEANLAGKATFKIFLFLDTVAVATSVIAVILLVYGKASRSAGSWKSFMWALQFMWASLISLMLAFYAALVAVVPGSGVYQFLLVAIYLCISVLNVWITIWVAPARRWWTVWTFLWRRSHSKRKYVIVKRQYPLAGASVLNFCLFTATSILALVGLQVIFGLYKSKGSTSSSAPAPSPL